MKLVPILIFVLITFMNVDCNEHYTFPPQFRQPGSGGFSSHSSIYLPPESHTAIPYIPMKNMNGLQFPYLPATGTKAPLRFPSPFPLIISTTMLPIEDDDDAEDDVSPSPQFKVNNRTERNYSPKVEKRDVRPKPMYQAIDRNDIKSPTGFMPSHHGNSIPTATSRSFIIAADVPDQTKSPSFQGPQYMPAPGLQNVFISSTTEPVIPIIRLSNEMDLDGSFSYEALGADQTHYVQHSRMENMGTDKEEQVVEGSYSYVGDNGQTYTVHYVADSNGFRASGDHLPVAPPIPEIIQRAVQYNLAEEAKKPPHLKSWQNDENELSESERNQRYPIAPKSLFTGRSPESFSFAFSQGSQNTQNNLAAAASTPTPIKANVDFASEQMKAKTNSGISPQITFVASQGAHSPSVNPQQTIGRMFTTERPTLPQLINYDAGLKESDQEGNKALWRWQYGINANINQHQQTPEKQSISRSSGADDDVIINFSDMTPEQYTSMIKSQMKSNMKIPNHQTNENQKVYQPQQQEYQTQTEKSMYNFVTEQPTVSTVSNYILSQTENWYNKANNQNNPAENHEHTLAVDVRPKLITHEKFIPPSQTVTQSYDYDNNFYESERIRSSTLEPVSLTFNNLERPFHKFDNIQQTSEKVIDSNNNQILNEHFVSSTEAPSTTTQYQHPIMSTYSTIQFSDFIVKDSEIKAVPYISTEPMQRETTTTEASTEDVLRNNMFLRNLFKTDRREIQNERNQIQDEPKNYAPKVNPGHRIKEEIKNFPPKQNSEHKQNKSPKFIPVKSKPHNEIQGIKKPLDIADLLTFISAKNHFESSKTKPKNKFNHAYNQKNDVRFIPMSYSYDDSSVEENSERNTNDLRTNYYQPEELRGVIKNYKVLQRNNSVFNAQDSEQLKRNLTPPSAKAHSSNLPPLGRAGPSMKSYLPPIYI